MSQLPPSQVPPDPPLARLAPEAPAPAAPVPPPPVPAIPVPNTTSARSRPGLLTALGVMSILGGVAGLAATVGLILFAVAVYAAAKAADTVAARSLPATPPAFLARTDEPPPPLVAGPDGLPDAPRRQALDAIRSRMRLTARRAEQLDMMLARAGRRILGVKAGDELSAESVRQAIVDHGELYAGSRRTAPPEYFKTAGGRVELSDERAVFHPDDGSPPVRTAARSSAPPKPLTAEQVQATVKQVQDAPGGAKLNPSQVSALAAVLAMPSQRLAQAAGLSSEPRSVTIHPGGGATVRFGGGELYLGSRGQILSQPPGPESETPAAANATAFLTSVVALGAGGVLAVVLLVAGVLILRDTPGRPGAGLRWMRTWAVVKIPVALAAGAALGWMLDPVIGGAAGGNAPRLPGWVNGALWLAFGVIAAGIVYATAVLVALRAKTVREFYGPVD